MLQQTFRFKSHRSPLKKDFLYLTLLLVQKTRAGSLPMSLNYASSYEGL